MEQRRIKQSFISYAGHTLWDLWCIASLVGIWPRFIEPNLLQTTQLNLPIKDLPRELESLHIVQFSDLHLHHALSDRFLNKIQARIQNQKPDLIVFTGDFICYAQLEDRERLQKFLNGFHAPLGCFAILGNHDYARATSVNANGEYDVIDANESTLLSGFKRLLKETPLKKTITEQARQTGLHQELVQLIEKSPFKLLHNAHQLIPFKNSALNLCGLGEYVLGKMDPEEAFKGYDNRYPGLILVHNPDAIPYLDRYPGHVILSGHTHGFQVNIPWMRNRFALLENEEYGRGLVQRNARWIYINRGVGSALPFRWFSVPEITSISLKRSI
jgi:predicted MPP superfamily phosphohydrolase